MRLPVLPSILVRTCALIALATCSRAASAELLEMASLVPTLLEVTVNGMAEPDPTLFYADSTGALYASAEIFERWRLQPQGAAVRHEGQDYFPVAALRGVNVHLSQSDQKVVIEAAPENFEAQRTSFVQRTSMAMTEPAMGFFADYDIQAEWVRDALNVSGGFDLGVFTRHGVGSSTFVAQAGTGRDRILRLETAWTIDRPEHMTTLRLGDTVSAGNNPIRFSGIQYGRNFGVDPAFVQIPLPEAEGSAALPSVAEVYVNNVLQGSRTLAPGPFSVTGIPATNGGGTVQIVVRDMLGRQQVIEQNYYVSTQMLRAGLHDFSYEAGFTRKGFGRISNRYGELRLATFHRYGLSDHMTAEGQIEATVRNQAASATLSSLNPLGLAYITLAASHSDRGLGFRAGGGFERSAPNYSIAGRVEFASRSYAPLAMPSGLRSPRITLQAYVDAPVSRGGIGFNIFYRDLRNQRDEGLVGLSGSWRVGAVASVRAYARRSVTGLDQSQLGLSLALGLGGRRSLSANVEHGAGRADGLLSFQQDAPAGTGHGFRATASFGSIEAVQAQYVRNLPGMSLTAEFGHARGASGLRLGARGAIGMVGPSLFASRTLGESFATVELPGHAGAKVYADNQLVGVTDRNGRLTIPALRAFETNVIRIDETDLPMDVQLDRAEIAVRPYRRTGTVLQFSAERERGVLMRVRLDDGRDLPAGADVRFTGRPDILVAVTGGEIYVPNLTGRAQASVTWANGHCQFEVAVPPGSDPQPLIDGLVCRRNEYVDSAR